MSTLRIETNRIVDHPSFYREFREAVGFPACYDATMLEWVDYMSALDETPGRECGYSLAPGELLTLEVPDSLELATRCPDVWQDLVECSAFVNLRRLDQQRPPILVLLLC